MRVQLEEQSSFPLFLCEIENHYKGDFLMLLISLICMNNN